MKRTNNHRLLVILPLAGLLLFAAAEGVNLLGYTLTGASWVGTSATYHVNTNFIDGPAGSTSQQLAAIQAGADEWGNAGGADFSFTYGGTTGTSSTAPDGLNAVYYSHTDGGGALAVCYWWTQSGNTTNFDIEFYDRDGGDDFIWAVNPSFSQFDIQSVACHEFGHALGLSHSTVNGATMYPSVSAGSIANRTIHADDMAGIQAIYGAAPASAPEVTGVVPARGFVDGAYSVTVNGSDFAAPMTVTFNGTSATNVIVQNGTSLTCTVPSGNGQGPVSVGVTATAGSNTLTDGFIYDTCRVPGGFMLQNGWNNVECKVPQDAGKFYRAIISTVAEDLFMSAIDPIDTRVFPLGWSDLFYFTLYANTYPLPYWWNTYGTLDGSGYAQWKLWGVTEPNTSGLVLHACFYVVDITAPSNLSTISNRVTVIYP